MNKVRFIVGLPGSGKTHYAKEHPLGLLFDDPAVSSDTFDAFKTAVKSGQDVTITDVYMVESIARVLALITVMVWNQDADIEWLYFENNPEACIANVLRRNDDRIVSTEFVTEASKHYDVPDYVKLLPIYTPEKD